MDQLQNKGHNGFTPSRVCLSKLLLIVLVPLDSPLGHGDESSDREEPSCILGEKVRSDYIITMKECAYHRCSLSWQ